MFFHVFLLFEALQILHSGVAAQLSGCGNQDIDSMTCQLHVTLLMWALWAYVTMGTGLEFPPGFQGGQPP